MATSTRSPGHEADAVPFNPTEKSRRCVGDLEDVPPYLFRVYSPYSATSHDEEWVRSVDATYKRFRHDFNIFDIYEAAAARMVKRHFRWEGDERQPSNLVSWTSSLLFALQFIVFLRKSVRDGSSFNDIKLCVVDTREFSLFCFIRDVDLIRIYAGDDPSRGLEELEQLRRRKHRTYRGSYNFGEYLSQGALRIEDKCSIVSARQLISSGLFTLQPLLRRYRTWRGTRTPPWANAAIRVREDFYSRELMERRITNAERNAASRIAALFKPAFRLPMAAAFLSLRPRSIEDAQIQSLFESNQFTGLFKMSPRENVGADKVVDMDRVDCQWNDSIVLYETLPEVTQFRNIIRQIYRIFRLRRIENILSQLQQAQISS